MTDEREEQEEGTEGRRPGRGGGRGAATDGLQYLISPGHDRAPAHARGSAGFRAGGRCNCATDAHRHLADSAGDAFGTARHQTLQYCRRRLIYCSSDLPRELGQEPKRRGQAVHRGRPRTTSKTFEASLIKDARGVRYAIRLVRVFEPVRDATGGRRRSLS